MFLLKIPILIVSFLILLLTSCSPDKDNPFTPTVKSILHVHNYYKDEETFSFLASYGLLNIGTLTLTCETPVSKPEKLGAYKLTAIGSLKGIIGTFSEIHDRWESSIDTLTLLPVKFSRHLQENKYRKDEFSEFNHHQKTVIVVDTTPGEPRQEKQYAISSSIEDMLSSFYLLRNIPFYQLKEGDTTTIDAFLENASYNVDVKYLGKEKIRSKFGKTRTIVVAPLLPNEGILSGQYPVKAWLTDDEKKIPLRVKVKTTFGAIEVNLQEYTSKNLTGSLRF